MNYGDHNFIEITQQTKLRVALVVSSASSQSSSTCRASRAMLFDKLRRTCRVEMWWAKWNLGLCCHACKQDPSCFAFIMPVTTIRCLITTALPSHWPAITTNYISQYSRGLQSYNWQNDA